MTKAELVEKIHAKAGLPTKAKAEEALDAVVASLREALAAGESVTFTGFGSFKVVARAARKGRNPRTGKEITIPASKVAKFTPGKGLKDSHQVSTSSAERRFLTAPLPLGKAPSLFPGRAAVNAGGCRREDARIFPWRKGGRAV